jgi:VWFA-related protein
VREVVLAVTVTDEKGKFVSDLEQKDFRILDEGKPQKIASFSHNPRQPTVIGFLVDAGSESVVHWATFRETIKQMVWALLQDDRNYTGYLISYGNSAAQLVANTTWDGDKLSNELDRIKPSGGSALFDAIRLACVDRRLIPGEPLRPRRVLVVFGDGHDTASKQTLEQAIELAQRNFVTVYAISTAAYGFDNPDRGRLERLATETGGRVEYPLANPYSEVPGHLAQPSDAGNYALPVGSGAYTQKVAEAIGKAVSAVQGEVTMQYLLSYVPDIAPDTLHRDKRHIKVEIPMLPKVKTQARPYYYLSGEQR